MVVPTNLPVIPLKGGVLFPGQVLPVKVQSSVTERAVEAAAKDDGRVFVVARRDMDKPTEPSNLYKMGVVATLDMVRRGRNGISMVIQAEGRAVATRYTRPEDHFVALASPVEDMPPLDTESLAFQALIKELQDRARELGKLYRVPEEAVRQAVSDEHNPGMLADQIAGFLDVPVASKQMLLEELDTEERMRKVLVHIQKRILMLEAQEQIKTDVQEKLGARQKEMYLREQLRAIQEELGEGDSTADDLGELKERLAAIDLPEDVQSEVDRELARLERAAAGSADTQVSRTYLEWIAELPWNTRSEDQLDINRASEILNEDHYGLSDVKNRILEFLSVRRLHAERSSPPKDQKENEGGEPLSSGPARGQIMLFAGPPGVGKTSIAKSIARALGRKYVRISLGGTRDESDIRGHRRTYVGSMPGRIIQGLKQAGTRNPVFLLDEIDKLGISFQGDPASALMEVLDPAQNDSFVDHYMNVPFDLSEVLFVATANYTQSIPGPLLDRMEVVEFTGYTEEEKTRIAFEYLIPRKLEETSLTSQEVVFSQDALGRIISLYTRESGVRQLEREIGRMARKVARKIASKEQTNVELTEKDVREQLGRPKVRPERAGLIDEVGVATGMYYTPVGGDIMFVEASVREVHSQSTKESPRFDGLGAVSLILTGQLGDVMKESARAALTYAATHAAQLQIPAEHLGTIETHIHVPAGAIPKDGPSAGITLATALVSAMSSRPVHRDVAMTGEITLRGKVLPIGGIKEKVLGAHRAGITRIILPLENEADLEDIPEQVREELEFFPVETLDQVLALALLPSEHLPYGQHGGLVAAQGQPTQLV